MQKINPTIRVSVYILVAAAGAVAVAWGWITQDTLDAIVPVVAGVIGVTGGGLAAAFTDVKPRETPPSPMEYAGMAPDVGRAILDEINRLRRDVATSPEVAADTSAGVKYVPEVAPWLQQAHGVADSLHDQGVALAADVQERIGRHRAL